MAINFPSGPSVNQIFYDPTSGFTYQWNGTVWVNYNYTSPAKIQELDDIKGSFNGVTQTFALTVSGSAVTPVKADQLIINIGGVAQNPGVDFTVSGSNINFTTAPDAGLDFYGVLLGGSTTVVSAASTSVGPEAFTTGGPSWNTSGDLLISGVTTIANTGTASTALTVSGNARISGIVTVGSSSITIDGTNNQITVGTGATLSSSGITVGIITGTFYGDGSGLDNVGVGSDGSINTTGIITASAFYGDGTGLLNLGGPLEPLTYSPGIGQTNVGLTTNIVITFNKPIKANTGTITLRTDSSTGTIIESFDVGTSSSISINGGVLTINPTSDLVGLTTYFVVFPAAVYKDTFESSTSVGITTYSFITEPVIVIYDYKLLTFGDNAQGQAARNDTTQYSSPVQVPGTQWAQIGGERYSLLATKKDGTLWGWGDGVYGQQGQSDTLDRSSPIQIPGTQWNTVGYTYRNAFSTKTDGTLWSWGDNTSFGTLGQNNTTQYSSPRQIPGTQWESAHGNYYLTYLKKTDGTAWVTGSNANGGLGINLPTASYRSSPVQIPGTQWSKVKCTSYNALFIKTDGTLWSWGRNNYGELGVNSTTQYSSPIQIPGTQWVDAEGGLYYSMARKSDGTLWSWGYGTTGILAQNNVTYYSSPIQIPGTQWNNFSAGQKHAFATKSDGTLWSWGYNATGQLGQNNRIQRSSPTQIPGTQWNSVKLRPIYNSTGILDDIE